MFREGLIGVSGIMNSDNSGICDDVLRLTFPAIEEPDRVNPNRRFSVIWPMFAKHFSEIHGHLEPIGVDVRDK